MLQTLTRAVAEDYGWFVVLAFRAVQMCLGPRGPSTLDQPVLQACDPVAFAMQMLEMEMIDDILQLMREYAGVRDLQHHGLAIIEILIMDDPEWRDEVARTRSACPLGSSWVCPALQAT